MSQINGVMPRFGASHSLRNRKMLDYDMVSDTIRLLRYFGKRT